MTVFDYLSASALSLVVSGNTGISPFFSLLMVGICERADPSLLNMSGNMEIILASWPALIFLGIMTMLEFLAKCIPVVDEVVDSMMVFAIPVMSTLGSLSTFGVFGNLEDVDMNNVEVNYDDNYNNGGGGGGARALQDEEEQGVFSSGGGLLPLQIILVLLGIGLAMLIHLFKMIVRLFGEGCLTNFITILETSWIAFSITLAIYIRPIAVCVAILLGCAAVYSFKRHVYDKRMQKSKDDTNRDTNGDSREVPLATGERQDNEGVGTAVPSTKDDGGNDDGETTTDYVTMKDT